MCHATGILRGMDNIISLSGAASKSLNARVTDVPCDAGREGAGTTTSSTLS